MAALLSIGGAYALASWDWCPRQNADAPTVVSRLQGSGPLLAGGAAVELHPPYPIVAAGYGPPRPELSAAARPLKARAVVLRGGDITFGVVSLDVLLVPDDVATEVRARSGLGDAWVVATHTHSSFGGYDARWVAQLAGTGRFRADARAALVDGAVEALHRAAASLQPVAVELSRGEADLCAPRSAEACDRRVTRLRFGEVAQWLMLAAHPTLVPRPATALDPDYPGALAEQLDAGVTLVLQTAVGNAKAQADGPAAMAERAGAELARLEGATLLDAPALTVTRVQLSLPAADATRLVPRLFAMPGRNFLCRSTAPVAEVGLLRLGSVTLAAVPAELTHASADALGVPALSVANGYVGYVEPPEVVDRAEGEARRQYYDRTLLQRLKEALITAGATGN